MNRFAAERRVKEFLVALRGNHLVAVALLGAHDALASRQIWPQGALQAFKEFTERFPNRLFRLAGRLDDTAPCPNCGKPEALIHLAKLKTYCWDCSYWGHDPSLAPKDETS